MKGTIRTPKNWRLAQATCSLLLVMGLLLPTTAPAQADGAPGLAKQTPEPLQFTSGGHVLGFYPGKMYVTNGTYALRVSYLGATQAVPEASQPPATEAGQNSQAAPPLTQVTYQELWPGITLSYDRGGGILRSTYTLAPGADPAHIRLSYNTPVEINAAGELAVRFETGKIVEGAPIAWQEVGGLRVPIEVRFVQRDEREVGFALGVYDVHHSLTIDPTLAWHTFLGGFSNEFGNAIAVDDSDNVYVAGSGCGCGSPVRPPSGGVDAFAVKLNASGTLLWNTCLGSSASEYGWAIAVDGSGNVHVAGYSGASWGSPVRPYSGGFDAFVAKLNASGVLTWNTFLGGGSHDFGYAIAVDGSGNVHMAGYSSASWGSPVRPYTGHHDALVAKLNASGALTWHTFLGGIGADHGKAIAVDSNGRVYVGGDSNGWGSPVRPH